MLNVNGPWIYTYDINGRLTTARKNVAGAITSGAMAYDAEGRLRQTVINLPTPSTSTRNLLHDGVNLVADYDATDTMVRRYVHGPGVDEPLVVYEGAGTATKNWQYADHLGSIIATADATGASTAIYTYGPFGESSLTTGIRYGYTGQRSMAALGLLYYKARFYSPSLGRFLQPDPIGYADDLNLYAYVGNNPVNFTDPSGLVANWAKGAVLAGADAASSFGRGFVGIDGAGSAYELGSGTRTAFDWGLIAVDILNTPISPGPDVGIIGAAGIAARGVKGGESAATAYGRQAHKNYENAVGSENIVFNQKIPGSSGMRPDAVDYTKNIVRELKPDSTSGIRAGMRQLERYVAELEVATKQKWQGFLDLYKQPPKP